MAILVETESGPVLGDDQQHSTSGVSYRSFRGIPFAQPPIGKLRFSNPVPVEPWSEVRATQEYGDDCAQYDTTTKKVTGSEDCLYLNIFTRAEDSLDKLPVMVWIHGGAFYFGSGSDEWYGPNHAMDESIVLVTLNYRLGPLGFLYTPDGLLDSNLGLKDQKVALQWIKKNISKFGGDPDNITLFGESAGAVSVHFQYICDDENLFHKMILQSGSSLNPWGLNSVKFQEDITNTFFRKLGLSVMTDRQELHQALLAVPVDKLVLCGAEVWDPLRSSVFGPTVDKDFIQGHPWETLKEVDRRMPVMMGVTSDEGAFKQFMFKSKLEGMKSHEMYAHVFLCDDDNDHETTIENATLIKKHYGKKGSIFSAGNTLISDGFFYECHYNLVLSHLDHGDNVFQYRYSHKGAYTLPEILAGKKLSEDLGVSHFDECLVQFYSKSLPPRPPQAEDADMKMAKLLWKLWAQFAQFGDPSVELSDGRMLEWSPVSKDEQTYMELCLEPKLKIGCLKSDNQELWNYLRLTTRRKFL